MLTKRAWVHHPLPWLWHPLVVARGAPRKGRVGCGRFCLPGQPVLVDIRGIWTNGYPKWCFVKASPFKHGHYLCVISGSRAYSGGGVQPVVNCWYLPFYVTPPFVFFDDGSCWNWPMFSLCISQLQMYGCPVWWTNMAIQGMDSFNMEGGRWDYPSELMSWLLWKNTEIETPTKTEVRGPTTWTFSMYRYQQIFFSVP